MIVNGTVTGTGGAFAMYTVNCPLNPLIGGPSSVAGLSVLAIVTRKYSSTIVTIAAAGATVTAGGFRWVAAPSVTIVNSSGSGRLSFNACNVMVAVVSPGRNVMVPVVTVVKATSPTAAPPEPIRV